MLALLALFVGDTFLTALEKAAKEAEQNQKKD